jgi:hypothetical protein
MCSIVIPRATHPLPIAASPFNIHIQPEVSPALAIFV